MDVKICVCLPRKYDRFMLFIDNNLLLHGQLFYIEKTKFRSVFANNSVFNLHFMKVRTENDNNFGYEKIRMLKFVFVYLANMAILCYSLTIICCCQVQDYIY
jgi:hypothetical protein